MMMLDQMLKTFTNEDEEDRFILVAERSHLGKNVDKPRMVRIIAVVQENHSNIISVINIVFSLEDVFSRGM